MLKSRNSAVRQCLCRLFLSVVYGCQSVDCQSLFVSFVLCLFLFLSFVLWLFLSLSFVLCLFVSVFCLLSLLVSVLCLSFVSPLSLLCLPSFSSCFCPLYALCLFLFLSFVYPLPLFVSVLYLSSGSFCLCPFSSVSFSLCPLSVLCLFLSLFFVCPLSLFVSVLCPVRFSVSRLFGVCPLICCLSVDLTASRSAFVVRPSFSPGQSFSLHSVQQRSVDQTRAVSALTAGQRAMKSV